LHPSRGEMYCRVIACDFDGTGAVSGRLAPEVAATLGAARALGFVTLLVTGRVLEDLEAAEVPFENLDAVVAENGAVVWWPATDQTARLGPPPPDAFLAELRRREIPYQAGAVVVGTSERHANDVLRLVRRSGMAAQLVFNRDALMLLPSGVDKAAGVRRALAELNRSERNMVAFGDAENDRPLLDAAEVGVAPRGAVAAIAAAADERLSLPDAAGVAHRIQRLVDAGGHCDTPARQTVVLGRDADGTPAGVPGSGTNVMISGDPRSGKSWIAGLLVEQLITRGYRVCVFDPEGDYAALAHRPGVLALGSDLPLPEPAALPHVLRDEPLSLVVGLAGLSQADKVRYVARALPCLEAWRAVSGIPHWTVLDEAHYFLNEPAVRSRRFDARTGSYAFVTYRPSLIAATVHDAVTAHVITCTSVEDERYFLTGLLQRLRPSGVPASEALASVMPRHAGLLTQSDGGASWQVFAPAPRATTQAHHGRKYAATRLPADKAFRFLCVDGQPVVASSVTEFCAAVATVPTASLQHHLLAGDFSRWAADVLGDGRLAAVFRKLEHTTHVGAAPSRDELLTHVKDLYLI
jgi:hydroxymethylpyrimidine pyrophosphatase-like HAD family hydrolase